MCGRFAASESDDEIAAAFDARPDDDLAGVRPSYNVAPTDRVRVVLERSAEGDEPPRRELHAARWGLIPSWAKDMSGAAKMINARLESVADKSAYRAAFAGRRCVVPVSGYYEWTTDADGRKRPHFIHPDDGGMAALAGLFAWWPDPRYPADHPDRWVLSTVVITTAAADRLSWIHDRMPAMLTPDLIDEWLDRANDDVGALTDLLLDSAGTVAGHLDARPVSTAVNKGGVDHPGLLDPEPPADR